MSLSLVLGCFGASLAFSVAGLWSAMLLVRSVPGEPAAKARHIVLLRTVPIALAGLAAIAQLALLWLFWPAHGARAVFLIVAPVGTVGFALNYTESAARVLRTSEARTL